MGRWARRTLFTVAVLGVVGGVFGPRIATPWVEDALKERLQSRAFDAEWATFTLSWRGAHFGEINVQRGPHTVQIAQATVDADWSKLWDGERPLGTVRLTGVTATVDLSDAEGSASKQASGPSRSRQLPQVEVADATVTVVREGQTLGRVSAKRSTLQSTQLAASGIDAQLRLGGVSVAVSEGIGQLDLQSRRAQISLAEITRGSHRATVRDAFLQKASAGVTAGGTLPEGHLEAFVAGPIRRPDLVHLSGSAVSLSALGKRAPLPMSPKGQLDGELVVVDPLGTPFVWLNGTLSKGQITHRAIADAPVEDLSGQVELTASRDPFTEAVHVDWVARRLAVTARGTLDATGLDYAETITLSAQLDPGPCQAAYDTIPKAMLGPYGKAKLSGTFAPSIKLKVPLGDRYALSFKAKGIMGACPIASLNAASAPATATLSGGSPSDVDWLNHPFVHRITYPPRPQDVGPGTKGYVRIGSLPKYVSAVMYLSEDPNFYRHGAVDTHLIQRALKFNLDRGRYVYGGSTLPQQLVKNLFLTRKKTLARKVQELLVAARVADVVPKKRLLELYLNCIEFAPGIYGINKAARYYFGISPRHLSPKQAVFLASAKPAPKYANLMRYRGTTPNTAYYKGYMRRILERLRSVGAVSQAQIEAAEPLVITW